MRVPDFYAAAGGDYADAITRLQSDALLARFLQMLPDDPSMAQLTAAMAAGDAAAAFRAVHTLKGIALNLSLSDLADACAALTERLLGRDALPDGIQPQYDAVLAQHTRILDALAQLTP